MLKDAVIEFERERRMGTGTAETTDLELLTRVAQDRDEPAFAEFLARHHLAAYNLACHLLRSREAAEDALQEAYFRAWRFAGKHRGDGTARSWLLRIVANESLRHLKRTRSTPVSLDEEVEKAGPDCPLAFDRQKPENAGDSTERMEILRLCVEQLPALHRQIITLYYGAGLGQKEIGAELEISQQVVSNKIQEAMTRLRRLLGAAGYAAALPILQADSLVEALQAGIQPPPRLINDILASRPWVSGSSRPIQESIRHSRRSSFAPWPLAIWVPFLAIIALVAGAGAYLLNAPSDGDHFGGNAAISPASEESIRLAWDFSRQDMSGLEVPLGVLERHVRGDQGWIETPGDQRGVLMLPELPERRAYRVTAVVRRTNRVFCQIGCGLAQKGTPPPMRTFFLDESVVFNPETTYTLSWIFVGDKMLMTWKDGQVAQFSEYRTSKGPIRIFFHALRMRIFQIEMESLDSAEVLSNETRISELHKAYTQPGQWSAFEFDGEERSNRKEK